jgi:Mor family transcriptional regulator
VTRHLEQVAALRVEILHAIVAFGEDNNRAQAMADAVLSHLLTTFAGERIYLPMLPWAADCARKVFEQWQAGVKPKDIARQLDVSLSTVYRVIRRRGRTTRNEGLGSEDWNL